MAKFNANYAVLKFILEKLLVSTKHLSNCNVLFRCHFIHNSVYFILYHTDNLRKNLKNHIAENIYFHITKFER